LTASSRSSRIGVALAALLAAACTGSAQKEEPYAADVRCAYEVDGRGYSYGSFGNPNPVEYRCKAFDAPSAPAPEVPPDVKADPGAPTTVIEPDPD
jgi:hypothetical protein